MHVRIWTGPLMISPPSQRPVVDKSWTWVRIGCALCKLLESSRSDLWCETSDPPSPRIEMGEQPLLEHMLDTHEFGLYCGIELPFSSYQPNLKALKERVAATPLRDMDLRKAASVFWDRCAAVQAHFEAAPMIAADHPCHFYKCTASRLGYYSLPSRSHPKDVYDPDMHLLELVVECVRSDDDVRLVLEGAGPISSEMMYHLIQDKLFSPLIKLLVRFPEATCAASDALALASVQYALLGFSMGLCVDEFRKALWKAVRADPARFEHAHFVRFACAALGDASNKKELDHAISFLYALRPKALHALGAGDALSSVVGECVGSMRRLQRVERMLSQVYHPGVLDMEHELRSATER